MICFIAFVLLSVVDQPDRALEVRVFPPEPVQGQVVLVELSGTDRQDQVNGSFGNGALRFFQDQQGRHRALAAVRLRAATEPVSLVVQVTPPDGDTIYHGVPVMVRERKVEERKLRVARKYVKPPREVHERIRTESRELDELWKAEATSRAWKGSFNWPSENRISSPFGDKRRYNQKLVRRHYGVDIDGQVGDRLEAIGAGTVVMVADRYYSGGTLVIDHGLKLFSLYFHMSEFAVEQGDQVIKGQLIGKVGRSGRVTGPHLHLSTRLGNVTFDPMSLLELDLDE